MSHPIPAFLQNRPMLVARAVVAFCLAYGVGSWAVDSGSLLVYALGLAFLVLGVRRLYQAIIYKHKK